MPVMASGTSAVEAGSEAEAASFRDPSGFLFTREGILYRQVNRHYQEEYDRLMSSGLYHKLVNEGLLIPHREVDIPPAVAELAYRVIQPERVEFISYPYEWCFSQLKDAALTTLAIQKIAFEFGMTLKDSSAYNIQFHEGRAVLIDSLSFETYQEGRPWVPYRQFCQHFLAPLSLAAYLDVRLLRLSQLYIDGLPLDLVSSLLPRRTRLNFALNIHIHLHAASQKRYASKPVDTRRKMSRVALLGLIESLEAGVRRLNWSAAGSAWGDYYEEEHNYTPSGLGGKRRIVQEYLSTIRPRNVWDLGANTGMFSRLASDQGIPTIAFDLDAGVVERNYLECRQRGETHLLPLIIDLTNPSPGIGWANRERAALLERGPAEAVLALALIHHLAIANNVPLERLAAFFHHAGKWLIIEFVPKSDSQVGRLLLNRADIFPDYTVEGFERAFSRYFTIHRAETIPDSERRVYLMEGR